MKIPGLAEGQNGSKLLSDFRQVPTVPHRRWPVHRWGDDDMQGEMAGREIIDQSLELSQHGVDRSKDSPGVRSTDQEAGKALNKQNSRVC